MAHTPPASRAELETGLTAFVSQMLREAPKVRSVVDALSELGPVALFGGALRDWCLGGSKLPPRDLDFVVDTKDALALRDVLLHFKVSRNNFSGYRVFAGQQL